MTVCVNTTCTGDCVPSAVTQGERVEWSKSYSDYPATEYDLTYRFRGPGIGVDIDATADDEDFDVEITAAQSTALATTGDYQWQAWLTEIADTDNTFMVDSGTIAVLPGFAAANVAAVDLRSNAQKTLDSIDAALLAFGTSDVLEYEIETPAGRRKVKRSDKVHLTSMRKDAAIRVSMERTKRRVQNGGSLMQSICVSVRENC